MSDVNNIKNRLATALEEKTKTIAVLEERLKNAETTIEVLKNIKNDFQSFFNLQHEKKDPNSLWEVSDPNDKALKVVQISENGLEFYDLSAPRDMQKPIPFYPVKFIKRIK